MQGLSQEQQKEVMYLGTCCFPHGLPQEVMYSGTCGFLETSYVAEASLAHAETSYLAVRKDCLLLTPETMGFEARRESESVSAHQSVRTWRKNCWVFV